jgi:transcriptional regulator with XRE-family HTH domain
LTPDTGHVSRVPPLDPPDPRLAGALKRVRQERGLTQEAVAYQSGLSVSAYARLERVASNPTWTTVVRVADALDVDLVELARIVDAHRQRA